MNGDCHLKYHLNFNVFPCITFRIAPPTAMNFHNGGPAAFNRRPNADTCRCNAQVSQNKARPCKVTQSRSCEATLRHAKQGKAMESNTMQSNVNTTYSEATYIEATHDKLAPNIITRSKSTQCKATESKTKWHSTNRTVDAQ